MKKIAVIGLGYVGLPLAVEFGKNRNVIGFDIDKSRVEELSNGYDSTNECSADQINATQNLQFSSSVDDIRVAGIYIITVPTPIDGENHPDLRPLQEATRTVGNVLSEGDIVIFESTVFPGATEEICVPILEQQSGLEFNKDFSVGYSPERINPGDKLNTLTNIKKITSGSNPVAAEEIDALYRSIIVAGTWKAASIKVAEAAKIIENTQRDINIAIINEFSLIFDKIGIDTNEVLDAAATKWNFMRFHPGLVGGHCIGVDPYYLSFKAQQIGQSAELIDTARKINNSIPQFVAMKVIDGIQKKKELSANWNVLILGLTFKSDCPDLRNSKVFDLINELVTLGAKVDVFDPWVNRNSLKKELNYTFLDSIRSEHYDGIIIAVDHSIFKQYSERDIRSFGKPDCYIFDIKACFSQSAGFERL